MLCWCPEEEMGKRKLFNPLHLEIVRLHWERHSNVEIAHMLDVHVNTVSKAINSEAGQVLLSQLRDRVIEEMLNSFGAADASKSHGPAGLPSSGRTA